MDENMKKQVTRKGRMTSFSNDDFSELVRSNQNKLESGFVILDKADGRVLVKDGSTAELRFRASPAGQAMPVSSFDLDLVKYRVYLVSQNLLT